MKKIKSKNLKFRFIVVATTIICLVLPVILFGGEVLALDTGLETTAVSSGIPTGGQSIASLVGRIIYIILSFLGLIFIILLIYGGFMRMTAQGSPDKVKTSMGIITSAVVGIIIILASLAITAFVLGRINDVVEGNNSGFQGNRRLPNTNTTPSSSSDIPSSPSQGLLPQNN